MYQQCGHQTRDEDNANRKAQIQHILSAYRNGLPFFSFFLIHSIFPFFQLPSNQIDSFLFLLFLLYQSGCVETSVPALRIRFVNQNLSVIFADFSSKFPHDFRKKSPFFLKIFDIFVKTYLHFYFLCYNMERYRRNTYG